MNRSKTSMWASSGALIGALVTTLAPSAASAHVANVTIKSNSGDVRVIGSSKATDIGGEGWRDVRRSRRADGNEEVVVRGLSDDIVVTIPAKAALTVKTRNARITVQGVRGAVRCRTVSGHVEIQGASSGADVKSVSGNVKLTNAAGAVQIRTISGHVSVAGGRPLSETRITTISGDIRLERVGPGSIRTTSGEVTVDGALGTGESAEIRSHSGDVQARLRTPRGVRYALHSFSGDLEVRGPKGTRRGEQSLEGTIGKGAARLRLSSFSGDIDLHLRP